MVRHLTKNFLLGLPFILAMNFVCCSKQEGFSRSDEASLSWSWIPSLEHNLTSIRAPSGNGSERSTICVMLPQSNPTFRDSESGAVIDLVEEIKKGLKVWNEVLRREQFVNYGLGKRPGACPNNYAGRMRIGLRNDSVCDKWAYAGIDSSRDGYHDDRTNILDAPGITFCLNLWAKIRPLTKRKVEQIIIHELGHNFGLCDQYNTRGQGFGLHCDKSLLSVERQAIYGLMNALNDSSPVLKPDPDAILGVRLISCLDYPTASTDVATNNRAWAQFNPSAIDQFYRDTYQFRYDDAHPTSLTTSFKREIDFLRSKNIAIIPECQR